MPIFNYSCSCGNHVRHCFGVAESKALQECGLCGKTMSRDPRAPTHNVVEVLDNGIMAKALERPAEAERLTKEYIATKETEKEEAKK